MSKPQLPASPALDRWLEENGIRLDEVEVELAYQPVGGLGYAPIDVDGLGAVEVSK